MAREPLTITQYANRRIGNMKSERSSFEEHWKRLAEFVAPRRGRFFVEDRQLNNRKYNSIINSAATRAHRIARSGILAGVFSPARPWFNLTTLDLGLMEFQPVKEWLNTVETILRAIFNGSNLYAMLPNTIGEMLLFGTAAMSHVDDFDDVARFYTHTVGSYYLGQNKRLVIDTMAREYEWTVEQIVSEFGYKNCSQSVRTAYDQSNYDVWYPIFHFVGPNPDNDPSSRMSRNSRFMSLHYESGSLERDREKDKFLRRRGFFEAPFYAPRWDVTENDVYGTDCPAMSALGDIIGLQVMEKRKAQAVDKMVSPPLGGPASLRNVPVDGLPGGLTLYDPGGDNKQRLEPIYQVTPQVGELRMDIKEVQRRIDYLFYVDLFLAITEMEGIQPRNELDLMQRNEERLLQIGPVLERIHGELAGPLIDRTFNQALRAGILPPPPQELQGQPLKVEYISSLAQAQRAVAAGSITRMATFVTGLAAGGFAGALDKFDADQAVDEMGAAIGVNPRLIVPDEVVAKNRALQAKQQQAMLNTQLAEQAAGTVESLAKAKTGDESALTALTRAGGQARSGGQ